MKELEILGNDTKCTLPMLAGEEAKHETSDNLVKDLLSFKHRFNDLPNDYLVQIFLKMLKDTMLLVAAMIGPLLTTTSGYIYLNMVGRPEVQGSFGLYSFLFFAFNVSIVISSMEKLGIELAKTIGQKDFQGCRSIFCKGMLTNVILFSAVTLPVVLFIEKGFLALGVDPVSARLVQQALSASVPLIIILITKELLQAFCMAQGHEHYFGNMGIFTSTLAIVLNYFTIVSWDLGILGWVLSRTVSSLVELCFVTTIYFTKTIEKSRGLVSFEETLNGFCQYFTEAVKFTLGTYSEYFGFEIAGFFVILSGKQYQTAAYYSAMNVSGLIYTFGIAFSCVARTRLNLLVGKQLQQTAKNFYEYFLMCTFVCGIVIGVLVLLLRDPLAACYASSHPELTSWFKSLLLIMAVAAASEAIATSGQIGLKTVGGIGHLLKYSILTLVVGNSCAGPIFRYFDASVLYIFGWTMFLTVVLNYLVISKALSTDWTTVQAEDEVIVGDTPHTKELL